MARKQDWSTRLGDVWVLSIDAPEGDLVLRVFLTEELLLKAAAADMREQLAKMDIVKDQKDRILALLDAHKHDEAALLWHDAIGDFYSWGEHPIEGSR